MAGLREAIEQGRLSAFVRQYRADQLRLQRTDLRKGRQYETPWR